jgi:hypothetical protein
MLPSSELQEVLPHISGITMFSTEDHMAKDGSHSLNMMVQMIDHQMTSLKSLRDNLLAVSDYITYV